MTFPQTTEPIELTVKVVNIIESSGMVLLKEGGELIWVKYDDWSKIDNEEFSTYNLWWIWKDGERFSGRPLSAKELIERD